MCRSIKKLRNPEHFPDDEDIRAAALQYVRKVSGYQKPSKINQPAFDKAVSEVTASTLTLLEQLQLNVLDK